MVSTYTKIDAVFAILLFVLLMYINYVVGLLLIRKQIYLGVPISFIIIIVCVVLVRIRKQKLASIGFTLKNAGKSLLSGAVFGIILSFFLNVLPKILAGMQIIPINRILYNLFYYFIVISLSEEVVFRGYIQTRIYGLIKYDVWAVVVTGFLFYLMHLPFQMLVNDLKINIVHMITIIVMHVIMNFLYRKHNSLVAPTVFHGLINFAADLLM